MYRRKAVDYAKLNKNIDELYNALAEIILILKDGSTVKVTHKFTVYEKDGQYYDAFTDKLILKYRSYPICQQPNTPYIISIDKIEESKLKV